jgi:single-stranded-DNA-specific exonuclease
MKHQWILKKPADEEVADTLSSSLGYNALICKILAMRNIGNYAEARAFFKPKKSDIHDPFLMKDMRKAVARVATAIENNEKILIYGDYDVDGTTSVALMYLYLSKIYPTERLDFYIPDRNIEGYGISNEGIDFAKANGFSLIIALDCGIKSVDKIDYANQLGVDFIICDHHLPGNELPQAVAVLDPKRKDCSYPFKELSGCGVGFKLCHALNSIYKIPEEELYSLLDLLAISIAADIVPMVGENRIFAMMGLRLLRKTNKIGLKLLLPENKIEHLNISNIVFEVAPKINAAGRISHAKAAVELMVSDDFSEASVIHKDILQLNDNRRELDSSITQAAIQQVIDSQQQDHYSTVVYNPAWNKGVIGIVASRLIEIYYKPTLVFTEGNQGDMVASARSVADFDLHDALEQCSDLFLKFGGHQAAAGLSMEKDKFEAFKIRFEEVVKSQIKAHQKQPSIEYDLEIKMKDLDHDFISSYQKLAPFGPQNLKPVLLMRNVKLAGPIRQIGVDQNHLKMRLCQATEGLSIEAIGYKMGAFYQEFAQKSFDILFTIEENHWRGNTTYHLNLRDVKFL